MGIQTKSYPSPQSLQKTWAANLKRARVDRGWTIATLAQLVDVQCSTIHRYENAGALIADPMKPRLAGALGMHPDQLFGWPTQKPPMPKPRQARKAAA